MPTKYMAGVPSMGVTVAVLLSLVGKSSFLLWTQNMEFPKLNSRKQSQPRDAGEMNQPL